VIKIDNALLQVGGFLGNSTNKTDHNDVTEILSFIVENGVKTS
jgi:hypothetical protein